MSIPKRKAISDTESDPLGKKPRTEKETPRTWLNPIVPVVAIDGEENNNNIDPNTIDALRTLRDRNARMACGLRDFFTPTPDSGEKPIFPMEIMWIVMDYYIPKAEYILPIAFGRSSSERVYNVRWLILQRPLGDNRSEDSVYEEPEEGHFFLRCLSMNDTYMSIQLGEMKRKAHELVYFGAMFRLSPNQYFQLTSVGDNIDWIRADARKDEEVICMKDETIYACRPHKNYLKMDYFVEDDNLY